MRFSDRVGALMSKKLFVLLIVSMLLATISILVLTLTGHDDMVRAAFGWVASSATTIVETLGVVGLLIVIALL